MIGMSCPLSGGRLTVQDKGGSNGNEPMALLGKARQLVASRLTAPTKLKTTLLAAIESCGLGQGKQEWQPLWSSICQVTFMRLAACCCRQLVDLKRCHPSDVACGKTIICSFVFIDRLDSADTIAEASN